MTALQAMISLSKADTAAIVPQSRVPAFVVMGTRDPDFPDATAEAPWLASELHAESLNVDGAGHYPHTEMTDLIAPKLLTFIAVSTAEVRALYSTLRTADLAGDSEGAMMTRSGL
jgi:pimeloyl-ACP methyl ester carboxylesterase